MLLKKLRVAHQSLPVPVLPRAPRAPRPDRPSRPGLLPRPSRPPHCPSWWGGCWLCAAAAAGLPPPRADNRWAGVSQGQGSGSRRLACWRSALSAAAGLRVYRVRGRGSSRPLAGPRPARARDATAAGCELAARRMEGRTQPCPVLPPPNTYILDTRR